MGLSGGGSGGTEGLASVFSNGGVIAGIAICGLMSAGTMWYVVNNREPVDRVGMLEKKELAAKGGGDRDTMGTFSSGISGMTGDSAFSGSVFDDDSVFDKRSSAGASVYSDGASAYSDGTATSGYSNAPSAYSDASSGGGSAPTNKDLGMYSSASTGGTSNMSRWTNASTFSGVSDAEISVWDGPSEKPKGRSRSRSGNRSKNSKGSRKGSRGRSRSRSKDGGARRGGSKERHVRKGSKGSRGGRR